MNGFELKPSEPSSHHRGSCPQDDSVSGVLVRISDHQETHGGNALNSEKSKVVVTRDLGADVLEPLKENPAVDVCNIRSFSG